MGRFIFVRHGQSEANAQMLIAQDDVPLTDLGLEQARQAAARARHLGIKTIICSPFKRARQTAEIIAVELGIELTDIKVIDELKEKELGDFKGQPREHEPVYYFLLEDTNNVESCEDMIKRAQVALEKIRRLVEEGLALVIGHSVAGFYLIQVAAGKTSIEDFDSPVHMQNADFIEVQL